jgi:hypothetical protein
MRCWRQDLMGPHHDAYEVEVSLLRKLTVGAWCFIFPYYPTQSIFAHQHPLRPTLTLQHMMWRSDEVLAARPHGTSS